VDGKLTRRSFTSREGKTIYVTEVVVDAINSIGSKKDANSGLSVPNYAPKNNQPVKKTEATQSIDSSFPEQVVKQTEGHDIHQQEKPKHDKDADID
jgi:single-stranded DNA-binding protein